MSKTHGYYHLCVDSQGHHSIYHSPTYVGARLSRMRASGFLGRIVHDLLSPRFNYVSTWRQEDSAPTAEWVEAEIANHQARIQKRSSAAKTASLVSGILGYTLAASGALCGISVAATGVPVIATGGVTTGLLTIGISAGALPAARMIARQITEIRSQILGEVLAPSKAAQYIKETLPRDEKERRRFLYGDVERSLPEEASEPDSLQILEVPEQLNQTCGTIMLDKAPVEAADNFLQDVSPHVEESDTIPILSQIDDLILAYLHDSSVSTSEEIAARVLLEADDSLSSRLGMQLSDFTEDQDVIPSLMHACREIARGGDPETAEALREEVFARLFDLSDYIAHLQMDQACEMIDEELSHEEQNNLSM